MDAETVQQTSSQTSAVSQHIAAAKEITQAWASTSVPTDDLPWWGVISVSIDVDGQAREFLIHTPPDYDPSKSYSAVFMFHGSSGSGASIAAATKLGKFADEQDFLAVFPVAKGIAWDYGLSQQTDTSGDFDYISAVQDTLVAEWGLAEGQSFAAGMSSGGLFTQYLAMNNPDMFEAYMSVGANLPGLRFQRLDAAEAVPMMLLHGTEDQFVPFSGGRVNGPFLSGFNREVVSADTTADFWADETGQQLSDFAPLDDLYDDGTSVSYRATADGSVQQYTISGGGHNWPGMTGLERPNLGTITQEINATELMLDFFGDYGL